MRTTLNIDDDLFNEAKSLTDKPGITALVHEGLKALIQRESARRLSKLGGTEQAIDDIPRRRSRT